MPRSTVPRQRALTLQEVCEELQITKSTFYDWRRSGKAPRCIKLPNGSVRVRRADLDEWLESYAEVPA